MTMGVTSHQTVTTEASCTNRHLSTSTWPHDTAACQHLLRQHIKAAQASTNPANQPTNRDAAGVCPGARALTCLDLFQLSSTSRASSSALPPGRSSDTLAPSCHLTTLPSLLRTTYLYWMCRLVAQEQQQQEQKRQAGASVSLVPHRQSCPPAVVYCKLLQLHSFLMMMLMMAGNKRAGLALC